MKSVTDTRSSSRQIAADRVCEEAARLIPKYSGR
jgi:hypothetical protein